MYNWGLGYTPSYDSVCTEQCVHHEISDELISLALDDEKNIQKQKGLGNLSTLPLNYRRDFIGSISHNGVQEKIADWGIEIQNSPYFTGSIHSDQYDFLYDRKKVDVQGSIIRPTRNGFSTIGKYTQFLIKNEKRHKLMDYYCFTAIDLDRRILHIAGVVNYYTIWLDENEIENIDHPAHKILTKDLTPLTKFIFRT
jgi:hypothetical protein